jgi:hypothetical protein
MEEFDILIHELGDAAHEFKQLTQAPQRTWRKKRKLKEVCEAVEKTAADKIQHHSELAPNNTAQAHVPQDITDDFMSKPLQLPHPIYNIFKDQIIQGWLLLVDSQDGNRSVCNPTRDGNMRACCCVLITKSTQERPEYEGYITASLTAAVYGPQNNSENGWSAWTSAIHHRKMREFRKKDGGPGFVNAIPFGSLFMKYRDVLCWVKRETAVCKYYHTQAQIEEMIAACSIEQVISDLFKASPHSMIP